MGFELETEMGLGPQIEDDRTDLEPVELLPTFYNYNQIRNFIESSLGDIAKLMPASRSEDQIPSFQVRVPEWNKKTNFKKSLNEIISKITLPRGKHWHIAESVSNKTMNARPIPTYIPAST